VFTKVLKTQTSGLTASYAVALELAKSSLTLEREENPGTLQFAHRVYLRISYDFHNKQRPAMPVEIQVE
jgi:hypothetical protein